MARRAAAHMTLGAVLLASGCLELGGSWDATSATAGSSPSTGTTAGTTSATTSTSTGVTGTTGSTSTAGGSETCGFAECDDVPQDPIECDLWAQDCPEGHKCMPWANDGGSTWNATKCTPVAPNPDQPGEPCTTEGGGVSGVDSCAEGAMCWDVDPRINLGYCVAMCTGSPRDPQCEPGFTCYISADPVLIHCLPWCDPLAQECPGAELCVGADAGFRCVPDASGDDGQHGDPCEYGNTCDPGLHCVPAERVPECQGIKCCSPYCDTTAPNDCPGEGQTCVPWFAEGEAPAGFENVGVCQLPR